MLSQRWGGPSSRAAPLNHKGLTYIEGSIFLEYLLPTGPGLDPESPWAAFSSESASHPHLSNSQNNKSKVIEDIGLLKVGGQAGPSPRSAASIPFYYWGLGRTWQGLAAGGNPVCSGVLLQAADGEPRPALPSLELMNQCE